MFEDKKILAFIGARGGSKGLPDKNIRDCAGRPLIAWTIDAARGCSFIDRIIVSTDSERIAQVARAAGADVPFLRPAELATDDASIDDAARHCLRWLKENTAEEYDWIVRLQPTSPLRTAHHIDAAIRTYAAERTTSRDTLVSVTEAPQKCGWLMRRTEEGYLDFCCPAGRDVAARQVMPRYYIPNGAIYIAPVPELERSGFYNGQVLPFIMPEDVSIDIDDPQDLEQARRRMGDAAVNVVKTTEGMPS